MSKFKVGDRVRALAKCTDPYYSNEGYFKVGEEFTIKEVFPSQNTVSLVERSQSWDESRFELVEEPVNPNITNFKVGDKVRRKRDSWSYGWRLKDDVCTVTSVYDRADGTQAVRVAETSGIGWDGFRFELVEEGKPVAPVVPQLPGIPEGFRAVRIGTPAKGEWFVYANGVAKVCDGGYSATSYVLLEKIDQPAPVEPAKPEAPAAPAKKVAPTFKAGDKVRIIENTGYEKFPKGTVDVVASISRHGSAQDLDLLTFDGALKGPNGMFAYRFELVTESPDDLVIQDRVPAREGVDFGWWVVPEKFDSFVPTEGTKWKMNSYYAGKMHGFATDIGRSLLFVMCYRKDLPELPTTEKVLLTEYIVWDKDGPKCAIWSSGDPTVETDTLCSWHHAHATGNTREVEVPIVKP